MNTREDWLRWRKGGIGSSDAPIIMGVSEWSTPLKLYEEKINPEIKEDDSNQYVKNRGNYFEPKIRAVFEGIIGQKFTPALAEMDQFRFMRASLDGRNEDKTAIMEIKLVGKDDWAKVNEERMLDKYLPQVQEQLLVTGAKVCYFVCFQDTDNGLVLAEHLAILEILPDLEYQARLLEACIKFWDCVTKKKPPTPSDRDYKRLKGVAKAANKWKRLKKNATKLKVDFEAARDELILAAEAMNHPRCVASGVKIQNIPKIGNVDNEAYIAALNARILELEATLVDYGRIEEHKKITADQFRAAGSTYWKLGE